MFCCLQNAQSTITDSADYGEAPVASDSSSQTVQQQSIVEAAPQQAEVAAEPQSQGGQTYQQQPAAAPIQVFKIISILDDNKQFLASRSSSRPTSTTGQLPRRS